MQVKVTMHKGNEPLLVATGINKEIINSLNTRVNLPLGGYLFIQQTEALTVVDVNSGKFTSSSNQAETILKTNIQAADEIARQLKLRNIGGMVVIDFIDMASRMDKLALLEHFELVLEKDKAKPQIGQLSDLGLVELTRHRQGQSLAEIFTKKCDKCQGQGFVIDELKFSTPTNIGESRAKMNKIKGPFNSNFNQESPNNQNQRNHKFDKNQRRDKNNQRNQQNYQNAQQTQQQTPTQELTKAQVNDLIDDLIKDVELNNVAEIEENQKENTTFQNEDTQIKEVVEEVAIDMAQQKVQELKETSIENQEEAKEEPKKLSRKAKKTRKKSEIASETKEDTEANKEEQKEIKEEKPKRRTRRTKSAKTTS